MRAWSEPTRALFLFALAAAPRLVYMLLAQPPFETQYWALAGGLLQSGVLQMNGITVTDYEPLYPAFLAGLRALTGDRAIIAQLLQVAVSSAGAVLLYRLTLTLSNCHRAAVISAVLFAFHPLLVRQAAAASDLALVTTLLIAFALAFVSITNVAGAAIAGVCLGLTILTRAMVLPLLLCGAVILFASHNRQSGAAFIAASCLVILPFALHSHTVSGKWLPTRSGINLYIGNSPYSEALIPDHDLDLLQEKAWELFANARPDVPPSSADYAREVDAFLTRRAIDHMMARPFHTLWRKVMNSAYFLSPQLVPLKIATVDTRVVFGAGDAVSVEGAVHRPRIEVLAHAVAASVLMLAGGAGVYIRRRGLRSDAMLWAIVATFVAVNAVFVPATRYVAPMVFVPIFYAGVALAALRKDTHGRFAS